MDHLFSHLRYDCPVPGGAARRTAGLVSDPDRYRILHKTASADSNGKTDMSVSRYNRNLIWHITWTDATAQTGWDELDASLTMEVETVGRIVYEDLQRVCIASSWGEDILGDITHIPAANIVSREKLK